MSVKARIFSTKLLKKPAPLPPLRATVRPLQSPALAATRTAQREEAVRGLQTFSSRLHGGRGNVSKPVVETNAMRPLLVTESRFPVVNLAQYSCVLIKPGATNGSFSPNFQVSLAEEFSRRDGADRLASGCSSFDPATQGRAAAVECLVFIEDFSNASQELSVPFSPRMNGFSVSSLSINWLSAAALASHSLNIEPHDFDGNGTAEAGHGTGSSKLLPPANVIKRGSGTAVFRLTSTTVTGFFSSATLIRLR